MTAGLEDLNGSVRPPHPSSRSRGEECGVAGVYLHDGDAAPFILPALHALQHRGQESAGVAWRPHSAGHTPREGENHGYAQGRHLERPLEVYRGMGLVAQVFAQPPADLAGPAMIGHTRYSTSGSSRLENAQPFLVAGPHGQLALAHNGHLSDTGTLVRFLQEQNATAPAPTDSALLATAIAHASGESWPERIRWALAHVTGSYGLALLTAEGLYAVRDPLGNRPLALGRLRGGWIVASESCAFLTVGATFVRDVAPGEIVRLDAAGPVTVGRVQRSGQAAEQAFCAFEYIYLARPDSQFSGRTVYEARYEMGRVLAGEQPADADLVAAVPDSGITAALGYAAVSGLPYREVLIKNRYVGRTFIHPGVESRSKVLALKFTPLVPIVAGKRIVLVDDSLVRGTTMRALVAMLRDAGAREVHLRIAAPAVRWPCFLGVDIPTTSELIAHELDSAAVCTHVGADSLGYLSVDGLAAAVASREGTACGGQGSLCTGCFTGHYPLPIPRREGHGTREERAVGAGAQGTWGRATAVQVDGATGDGRLSASPRGMGVSG